MRPLFQSFRKPTGWRDFVRRFLLNKYVLVLLFFALLFIFTGDQSLINSVQRNRRIRQTKEQLEQTRQAIDECKRDIRTIKNTDSLERYAREHYYMHADNEDVYLIDE